ncbi:8749_t:CDS:10 [Acaulospora morrowiae]|uniref:8749_t:CDS:1 n=1 Tax=Acaulospora morrowiae TaxID=94023 RepID=A0A9N9GSG7_9GLOM|nr:8749_t:CDS:10 [Acaulospora morrowiae]
MSAHSYHIPVNKIVSQTRKTEPVTTIVSTSPPNVAAKTIHPLPSTTIAHLENIFEAVKKQVAIWGEHARWKIDLVLLPDEESETQNQIVGGPAPINPASPSLGLHSPISENTPSSSNAAQDSKNQIQVTNPIETDVFRENDIQPFSMLEEDGIEKLDLESAKRMIREAMHYIREFETMLDNSTREYAEKIKDANNKLKKANDHIEGMTKYHIMREKEKSSKHTIEIQLLQEDLKILSRKLKEANAQLAESRAKQTSLQQEQDIRKERSGQKERRSSRKKITQPHSPSKQERVGQIVEYVPQQQTNGYVTYNFPYNKKSAKSFQMTHLSSPEQYKLSPSSSSTVHNRINYPSMYSMPPISGHPMFAAPPIQPVQNGSIYNNRVLYPTYTFPQSIGSQPTYPMQLNDPVPNQSTELSFSSMQMNTQTVSFPYSSMRVTDHTDHSGLDNLSLAAELILSSAVSEISSKTHNNEQNAASNVAHGRSETREEKSEASKYASTSSHNLHEDQNSNAKADASINGRRSKASMHENDDSLKRFLYTSESITLRNNNGRQAYQTVSHELDGQSTSTPVSGTHEDERQLNCFRNEDESDLMETDENVQEEEGDDGGNNVDVSSNSTFDNESDDTPSPSPKTRSISPNRVPPVRI